jgi:hypothetical protein
MRIPITAIALVCALAAATKAQDMPWTPEALAG